jgi:hypothetical protein
MTGTISGGPYRGQYYRTLEENVGADFYRVTLPGWVTVILYAACGSEWSRAVRDVQTKYLGD